MPNSITINIKNRQGTMFSDTVKAVSSYNDKGPFDILSEHENFISLIKQKIVIHKLDNKTQEFKIDNGVLRVYKNNVNIFIGI
ncbi:MAG: hypothetical protein A3B41_02005 [Candidatus Levybacteria bacterium RIFCSPLOWO2_01_FULL_37_26]|nr:MAG: hypothetical protein A3B41_02005 [Candidatus Levybacteria bacterium RIFCSPLOWO2_01_FULL_37_26]